MTTVTVKSPRNSIFFFAPSEMSSSAFWAWIFQSLDGSSDHRDGRAAVAQAAIQAIAEREKDAEAQSALNRLLRRGGVPDLRVFTEYSIGHIENWGRGRLDIVVTLGNEDPVLIIENKAWMSAYAEQISAYERGIAEKFGQKKFSKVIFSTAFDEYQGDGLNWEFFGLEKLQEFLRAAKDHDSLILQYGEWLEYLRKRREVVSHQALSDKGFATALEHVEGQWALMSEITKSMKGEQYRGVNRSGEPWTQFCFTSYHQDTDFLFYRIDWRAGGYYFSLRQYNDEPDDQKQTRLEQLRELWAESLSKIRADLISAPPSNRGTKESEIAVYFLSENPPTKLIGEIPRVHWVFCSLLSARTEYRIME